MAKLKMGSAKRRPENSKTAYFLGIDGGGTQTTAWLANNRSRILARVVAGPSNPLKVGLHLAQRNLIAVSRQVLRKAGLRREQKLAALCAGVAGIGRPPVYREILQSLKHGVPAHRYFLTHDAAIALESALGSSPGVIVIAGTGSIALGRDKDDHILRCGGWGSTFGDIGSGYDIGRKAVSAALAAFDGCAPSTRLGKDICRALHIREIADVVTLNLTPGQVAALFPLVCQAARSGDRVAQGLCREAGSNLAEMASSLLFRIGVPPAKRRVACAGGVFKASPEVRRRFNHCVRNVSPGAKIGLIERHPVEGALNLAMAISKNPKDRRIK